MTAADFIRFDSTTEGVLRVFGEVDLSVGNVFHGVLEEAMTLSPDLIIDLSGVTHLDSEGLGILITLHKRFNGSGHSFTIVSPERTPPRRVFDITRVGEFMRICESVEEAGTTK